MGSSVHDDIGDRRIPAMPCSDSQPTRNVSVAGFVAGGAGGVITQITPKPCCMGCRSGTAGGIRPQPDLPTGNLPSPMRTFDPDGSEGSVNFDKDADHLPT
jgi:hypothetical protein